MHFKRAKEGGGKSVLGFQPTVRQALAITHLDRKMEIAEDMPAALRSVGIEA